MFKKMELFCILRYPNMIKIIQIREKLNEIVYFVGRGNFSGKV